MNRLLLVLMSTGTLSDATLHAGPAAAPIPGWLVLIGGVLGLWTVIGGGVAVADRFLQRVWDEQ